jgi:hypothetical protein
LAQLTKFGSLFARKAHRIANSIFCSMVNFGTCI